MMESRKSNKKATENQKSQKKPAESWKTYLAVNQKMPFLSGGKPEKIGETGRKWKEMQISHSLNVAETGKGQKKSWGKLEKG